MSIIPFDVIAPVKIPTAATAKTKGSFDAFEPTAALRKLPASVETPAVRS